MLKTLVMEFPKHDFETYGQMAKFEDIKAHYNTSVGE